MGRPPPPRGTDRCQARRSSTSAPSPSAAAAPTTTTRPRATGSTTTSPRRCRATRSTAHSRKSFGINVLGTLVVEIEADDGVTGFAVTTGGEIGAWIVEKHLARFIEGQTRHRHREDVGPDVPLDAVLRPQGHRAQRHLRRRPRAVGPARPSCARSRSTSCSAARCATSSSSTPPAPAPTWPRSWASSAARCRCSTAPPRARRACAKNLDRLADMRAKVGDDFWLMFDCWMSLDLNYATRLAHAAGRATA